jgi:hypothetical protein
MLQIAEFLETFKEFASSLDALGPILRADSVMYPKRYGI